MKITCIDNPGGPRLSPEERAKDLAARLTVEEIAGLMMYSSHQMVPFDSGMPFRATYGGKTFEESGAKPWELTDQQKKFLTEDHLRHVLVMLLKDARTAALWNNELQAYDEGLPHGLPVNISSDPRNGAASAGAEYKSGGGQTSTWPEGLGIATALSPQVDVGTEPRWMRVADTFGAHPGLVADMGRACCDGMQSDSDRNGNRGSGSVSTMAKHWPGVGPCEAGRDAHYAFGKFAVHPGGEQVGNSYSKYIIGDLLRQ